MKDIPGLEGLYAADELGNIYTLAHTRIICPKGRPMEVEYPTRRMSPNIHKKTGRLSVNIVRGLPSPKRMMIHRLVAMAFLSFKEMDSYGKEDVTHVDGDRTNNRVENLKIITRQENNLDTFRSGRRTHDGSNNPCHYIDKELREKIKDLYAKGFYALDISFMTGVGKSIIARIIKNECYKSCTDIKCADGCPNA